MDDLCDVQLTHYLFVLALEGLLHKVLVAVFDAPLLVDLLDLIPDLVLLQLNGFDLMLHIGESLFVPMLFVFSSIL